MVRVNEYIYVILLHTLLQGVGSDRRSDPVLRN